MNIIADYVDEDDDREEDNRNNKQNTSLELANNEITQKKKKRKRKLNQIKGLIAKMRQRIKNIRVTYQIYHHL